VDNNKINDAKQYTYFAGKFDCHGDVAVQKCGAHRLMEHIRGFTRSHWMLPLGETYCPGGCHDQQFLMKNKTLPKHNFYFFLQPSNFQDPK
jgi:hypothetical protein